MTQPTHVTFYQLLGGVLFLATPALGALAFLRAVPVDKFVLGAIALPAVGGIALMRPKLLDRGVRAASRRIGGGHAD